MGLNQRFLNNLMFLIWLLWVIIAIGGAYLSIGYGLQTYRGGFEVSNFLNTVVYGVCALYALPKLIKLLLRK